ncbi:MAG: insulinase family protein [Bdellovibrionales bacterium]|nr:insulinase family protein [Bdellovibrionales bacterium]
MAQINRSLILSFCLVTLIASTLFSAERAFARKPLPPGAPDDAISVSGLGIQFPVEKEILENGLTVLYMPDHSAPLVSYHTWFKVGSKDEKKGVTGIAHLFEHMMFKGSKKYSGDQFDLLLQSNGATNNAFTTQDYTGYYINAPASKLELLMDIESDRMATLKIDKGALDSEREVVKEEKRYRVDDNPMGLLWQGIFSTVFKQHPYSSPVIGTMEDLNNVTPEIAQSFHRVYYSPSNAVVVLAGDFDLEQAKQLVRKYYGPIPKQEVARVTHPKEPKQTSPRSAFIKKDVKAWTMAISYPAPEAGTPESYALDLLAAVLGRGQSSRLNKRIVYKDQAATSVGVSNNSLQDAGLFQIFVTLKPAETPRKAQAQFLAAQRAVYGEMWRPRHLKISDQELERARNQILASQVEGLKTVHGKAEAIAAAEIMFGDYRRVFTDLDRYMKVTSKEIQLAAAQYLSPERSNLVVVRPKGD